MEPETGESLATAGPSGERYVDEQPHVEYRQGVEVTKTVISSGLVLTLNPATNIGSVDAEAAKAAGADTPGPTRAQSGKEVLRPEQKNGKLSCPFRKRNPRRFNIRQFHSCASNEFGDLSTLKYVMSPELNE